MCVYLALILDRYVEWSSHEPEEGMYDFSGIADLASFLTIAQDEDLVVILRLGPFMDAERDMVRHSGVGGLERKHFVFHERNRM